MRSRLAALAVCVTLLLLVSACAVLEAGIESSSASSGTGSVNWQATAEALQAESTRRSSEASATGPLVAAEVTPALVPTAAPPAQEQAVVAYVQGGDIWVKPLPDGEARRLTQDGRNTEPRWSVGGEWLAFVKNSELPEVWLVHLEDGAAQRVAAGVGSDGYAWSPTEDKLAVAQAGKVQIYTPNAGAEPALVSEVEIGAADGTLRFGKVAWSPNGQELAFTTVSQQPDAGGASGENDGLWVWDTASNQPELILASELPEKGEFILRGWSGDGAYLLYWQSPIPSASILADGVPLYSVPAAGGTPQVVAESVLPYEDNVQSQPNGLPQIAIVEGSGREMWHNKRLRAVALGDMQVLDLSPEDQAVSSPVWSPSGDTIAYIGMPDVEGAGGGDEAQSALNQRKLWIVETGEPAAHPLNEEVQYREEAPQWIDDESVLLARMDADGRISLWQVSITSGEEQQIVEEITPAPDWFGFYGHIRWQELFALWRPSATEQAAMTMVLTPTVAPPPAGTPGAATLATFLDGLHSELTAEEAIALWGEPDEITGSGLLIYQYALADGVQLWLAFPGDGPLSYARLQALNGRSFDLVPTGDLSEPAATESLTPTATPIPTEPPPPTRVE